MYHLDPDPHFFGPTHLHIDLRSCLDSMVTGTALEDEAVQMMYDWNEYDALRHQLTDVTRSTIDALRTPHTESLF